MYVNENGDETVVV